MPYNNNTLKLRTIAGANIKTNIVYTLIRKYPKRLKQKSPLYLREVDTDDNKSLGQKKSSDDFLGESLYSHFIDWILFFDVDFSLIASQLRQDFEHGHI